MSKHSPKQITLDLTEWIEIQNELNSLKTPLDGTELTPIEIQEATGILFLRALENPNYFRQAGGTAPLDLGKYKAIFTTVSEPDMMRPALRIHFIRT